MPVFNDFSENGELLGTNQQILSEKNFERYLKQFGKERAEGYLDALIDITNQVEGFLTRRIGENDFTNTSARISALTKNMLEEKLNLLQIGNRFIQKPQ
ncbi:MAG: hypothetical protein QM737_09930 [Ferruginibacter sp.]